MRKRVVATELALHRLVAAELPLCTSAVTGVSREGGDWLLETEQLQPPGPTRDASAVIADALEPLARVHAHFGGRAAELTALGLRDARADLPSGPLGPLLQALGAFGAPALDEALTEALVDAEALRVEALRTLGDRAAWTLVHNDFHRDNVVFASSRARLVDWGSAALQHPAWDLVACDRALIARYLECREQVAEPFYRALRAAVICRMHALAWSLLALGTSQPDETSISVALDTCVRRFVAAASAPRFDGGMELVGAT